jgi:hypothetical protein
MTIEIIDVLEPVDVEAEDCQLLVPGLMYPDLTIEPVIDPALIVLKGSWLAPA